MAFHIIYWYLFLEESYFCCEAVHGESKRFFCKVYLLFTAHLLLNICVSLGSLGSSTCPICTMKSMRLTVSAQCRISADEGPLLTFMNFPEWLNQAKWMFTQVRSTSVVCSAPYACILTFLSIVCPYRAKIQSSVISAFKGNILDRISPKFYL